MSGDDQATWREQASKVLRNLDQETRLLGVSKREQGWRVELDSQGLGLDDKSDLEQQFLQQFAQLWPQAGVPLVYFKRRGPAPAPKPAGPFGAQRDVRAIPGVREIIVVASGKGGVGKSTVSANLAVALARQGHRVGLLDADIYGPSAPMMLGLQGSMTVTQASKLAPREAHGVGCVSFGMLTEADQPVIWRGPLVGKALRQLLFDVDWGDRDYLIIDLPPGTGDVQLSLIESVPLHGALIVTTPQNVALLDAHKAMSMFERLQIPVLGVVENMAEHICSACGHRDMIFGEEGGKRFSEQRGVPVVARIPLVADIRAGGDSGQPIASQEHPVGEAFSELAKTLVAAPQFQAPATSATSGAPSSNRPQSPFARRGASSTPPTSPFA